MARVRIPKFLHEVFGETQSWPEIAAILGFGAVGALGLLAIDPARFADMPLWRAALALLLVFDICAGAIANLTRGTNDFYAERPRLRWVFIAVHLHLVALAWLIGEALGAAAAIWIYTIAAASIVNLLAGRAMQRAVGGVLFGLGALAVFLPMIGASPVMQAAGIIFMFKLIYAFAVDHRGEARV